MRTRSVDIAAYLHLNGVEPTSVTFDQRFKVRDFTFRDGPELQRLVRAYDEGAHVPAKLFVEARAFVKRLKVRENIEHKRGALAHVKGQVGL